MPTPETKAETTRLPVIPLRGLVAFPGLVIPLQVGRDVSVTAAYAAADGDSEVLLVAQLSPATDSPGAEDLYEMGTTASVLQCSRGESGVHKITVEAAERARVLSVESDGGCLWAEVERVDEPELDGPEAEALARTLQARFFAYLRLNPNLPETVGQLAAEAPDARALADTVAAYTAVPFSDKQQLLEMVDPIRRLETLADLLEGEIDLLEIQQQIAGRVRSSLRESQKEYFLREQLKAIEEELGSRAGDGNLSDLRQRIEASAMPDEVREVALREQSRLAQMSPLTPQSVVITEYIDWLLDMPWRERTEDNLDLRHVRATLDEDHFGLAEPKERILEYLAVKKLSHRLREPILCFVGPPGVGKTSLARSVARALGRRFVRKSLGGVRDEAEIRGHRRTYVGAMPGRVIQSIRKAGVRNPIFLLDEIDKMGNGTSGDPASALLEVLDPDENHSFSDHYLEVEYDLSEVLFICTANVAANIPRVLLDRLEVIELTGYTLDEKVRIAEEHLVPRELQAHGLSAEALQIPTDVVRRVVEGYTREAGVRNLRKQLASVARKVAMRVALADDDTDPAAPGEPRRLTADDVREFLGPAKHRREPGGPETAVGSARSLAWTEVGGRTMLIEVSCMPGTGELTLTGQLGDVMQESVKTALSWVRSRCSRPGVIPDRQKVDLHVHVPEGATRKDGPSAGLPVVCALASAMSGSPARGDIGATGEITLQGRVLPVGGVKEKVLAAHREGVRRVFLPSGNRDDLEKIPEEVRREIDLVFVDRVEDCLREVVPGLKSQFRRRAPTHKATDEPS